MSSPRPGAADGQPAEGTWATSAYLWTLITALGGGTIAALRAPLFVFVCILLFLHPRHPDHPRHFKTPRAQEKLEATHNAAQRKLLVHVTAREAGADCGMELADVRGMHVYPCSEITMKGAQV